MVGPSDFSSVCIDVFYESGILVAVCSILIHSVPYTDFLASMNAETSWIGNSNQARREGGTPGTFSRGPQSRGAHGGPWGSMLIFSIVKKGKNKKSSHSGHSLFLGPLPALLWHSGALLNSLVAPSLHSKAPQGPPRGRCRGSWALGPLGGPR